MSAPLYGADKPHLYDLDQAIAGAPENHRQLVSDAGATQVKSLFLRIQAAQQQLETTRLSVTTSKKNPGLANRAYQTGAVDPQKVIETNLFDAITQARAPHLAEISYRPGKEAIE
jgi:hypothetical protein